MDATTSLFTVLILLFTFVFITVGSQFMRRQRRVRLALRRIPAFQQMPRAISEAVESERPIHISFGGSGLGSDSTLSALAVADMLYPLAERAAIAKQVPIVSLSDATTLGLAQGTLLRAYRTRQNMKFYTSAGARWYPNGPRSLAFAAGVSGAMADEDSNLSVVGGRFGPEIAFIGEQATRYDQKFYGQSDQLDGQAIAWVMGTQPLVGEELYVAGTYLPTDPSALHLSQLITMEALRLGVILAILLLVVLSVLVEYFVLIVALIAAGALLFLLLFIIQGLRNRGGDA